MATFSNTELEELLQEAEVELSREIPCILDRVALNIAAGVATYSLPTSVIGVRRVTWKGRPLYLYKMFEAIENVSAVNNVILGQPREYLYDNLGLNTIRLFPVPNEDLATTTTGLWDTSIITKCIVEFTRKPDFTSSVLRIPNFLRRRTTKGFVLQRCFAREGIEQDLKAADYWGKRYAAQLELSKEIYNTTFQSLNKEFSDDQSMSETRFRKPARPQLPSKYWTV